VLATYGVVPPLVIQDAEINCAPGGHSGHYQWSTHCRREPVWCELTGTQARDAPATFYGTIPCELPSACPGFSKLPLQTAETSGLKRCLAGRRIVLVGDSVITELALELLYLLARRSPRLILQSMAHGYKASRTVNVTRYTADGLTLELCPHQRNMTFEDTALNLSMRHTFAGSASIYRDHQGLSTLVDPEFEPTLRQLGLFPGARRGKAPHVAVFGTTFHDDYSLSLERCGTAKPRRESLCSTARRVCRRPTHLAYCSLSGAHYCARRRCGNATRRRDCDCPRATFPRQLASYEAVAAQVAAKLTAVQRQGHTMVIWCSLFARKQASGGVDPLRAVVDAAVHSALSSAGFFRHGGHWLDMWPLSRAYFETMRSGEGQFGPSSLHHAAHMFTDQVLNPDLVAMRVQALLGIICNPAQQPLCGVGTHFLPQAAAVRSLQADCACGKAMLSIGTGHFCRADDNANADLEGNVPGTKLKIPEWDTWDIRKREAGA